jgi:hypothetical protein
LTEITGEAKRARSQGDSVFCQTYCNNLTNEGVTMLSKEHCALLKSAKTVQSVAQKPVAVVPPPKPVSMGEAFSKFSITEYQRSKFN